MITVDDTGERVTAVLADRRVLNLADPLPPGVRLVLRAHVAEVASRPIPPEESFGEDHRS